MQTKAKYDVIIACLGDNANDDKILSRAYKLCLQQSAKCIALHVLPYGVGESSPRFKRLYKKAFAQNIEVSQHAAETAEKGIIEYAETLAKENANILLILGDTRKQFISLHTKSFLNNIKNKLNVIGVDIELMPFKQKKRPKSNYTFIAPIFSFNGLAGMIESVIYVAIAFLVSMVFVYTVPPNMGETKSSLFMVFLIACVVAALRGGVIPGLIAGVFSLLTINFFFLQPMQFLMIKNSDNVASLLIFFAASIIISLIGSGMRRFVISAEQKQAYLNALLNISETLNRPLNEQEALAYIHNELKKLFATEIIFYGVSLMAKDSLVLKYPENISELSDKDLEALSLCQREFISTGHLTGNMPESPWYFEPMMSARGFEGVLAVRLANSELKYDSNISGLLLSFADLSATILDRIDRTQKSEDDKIHDEKEKLRTMLLSSVSHDLKTPLASIIGSLDVFQNLNDKLPEDSKKQLIETAYHEALRLDSFITNILDMSKLESGSIKFKPAWVNAGNFITSTINSAHAKLGSRAVDFKPNNSSTEIEIDHTMMQRAFANLFDNIGKYTPADSPVKIVTGFDADKKFYIRIEDKGPGIEKGMLEAIFNKYTRIKKKDTIFAGTGLGLPISKHIIESHGGNIVAFNNEDIGTTFQITLPTHR